LRQFVCQSPRAGTAVLRYGEMRSWKVQGDGRYGNENSIFGKDGEVLRHWGQAYLCCHNPTPSCRYGTHTEEHHNVTLTPS